MLQTQERRSISMSSCREKISVVTVGAAAGDSISETLSVTIPMMTNSTTVKKGEELVFQVAHKDKKRKEHSWKDDVADTRRAKTKAKHETKAKAKSQAAPMEVAHEI